MSDYRKVSETESGPSAATTAHQDPYQRPDQIQVWRVPGQHSEVTEQLFVRHTNRRRRGIVGLCAFAATIGALLIMFNSPMRNELLAPGPLTSHHAQILAGMGGDRCAACHSAGNGSWLSWVGLVKVSEAPCPKSQSDLCLSCHQQSIPPQLAANPHSLEKAQIEQLTSKYTSKFRLAGMHLPESEQSRELTCAACHAEHHGAENKLTTMTDQQCQTCHTQRHQSFESDHPDFSLVGTQLPSALHFDHNSHFKKYFPEGKQEFACASCHLGDSQKNVMSLASYEMMCSSCHDQTIRTTGQQGLVLLELPMLDLERLQSVGVDVGAWPKEAQGDFAGRLHSLTWTLLYRDESLREVLETFPAEFDFSEVDSQDPTQLKMLGELVRGIKKLMVELGSRDLQGVMGIPSRPSDIRSAVSSDLQFFRDAVAVWFPEMAAAGGLASSRWKEVPANQKRLWVPETAALARWLQDQEPLAINPLVGKVSPIGTEQGVKTQESLAQAVPTEKSLSSPGPLRQEVAQNPSKEGSQVVDDNSRQEAQPEPSALRGGLPSPSATATAESETLVENPLKGLRQQREPIVPNLFSEKTTKDPSDSIDNLGPQRKPHAPPHKSAANQPTKAPAIEPDFSSLSRNQLPQPTLLRGWNRDDQGFKLVYYVAEHGDPFWPELQRWNTSLAISGDQRSAELLSGWLTRPAIAGACFSCHASQNRAFLSDSAKVDALAAWQSPMRAPERKGFTRFNHAPHLLQLKCSGCHQPAGGPADSPLAGKTLLASWPKGEKEHGPTSGAGSIGESDFAPIGRATCIQCHRQEQASSSCTTCHAYHVDQQWAKTLEQMDKE